MARRLANIVGIDFYPRHALASVGPLTLYLDGGPERRGSSADGNGCWTAFLRPDGG